MNSQLSPAASRLLVLSLPLKELQKRRILQHRNEGARKRGKKLELTHRRSDSTKHSNVPLQLLNLVVQLPPLGLSLPNLLLSFLDSDPHGLDVGSGGSDDLSLVGSNTGDLDF